MPDLGDDPVIPPKGRYARREAFAQGLARGLSQAAAYAEAGFSAHRSSASKLAQDPSIVSRVAQIQGQDLRIEQRAEQLAIEKLAITKERILQRYAVAAFKELDEKEHPIGWAEQFKALEALARILQMFRVPVDVSGNLDVQVSSDDDNIIDILLSRLDRMSIRRRANDEPGRADVSSGGSAIVGAEVLGT